MTVHIGAQKGEIAETVLMPGDPYRAKWAAETFLTDVRLVNEVRGMLGFTGTWNGHPVTIQGSGMGMPSLSIYANELIRDYGAKTLIRIGSCGGMQPHVGIRDVILPGDMKDLMNKVTEARKAAEANLISRREETAAMRSQANTAKLLTDNPTLMRLKELEALEKVVENVGSLTVYNGLEGILSDTVKLGIAPK